MRGIDNLATGKLENLDEIRSRIDFRQADILDLPAVKDACAGVDFVLHQAAIPSVPKSVLLAAIRPMLTGQSTSWLPRAMLKLGAWSMLLRRRLTATLRHCPSART